VTVKPQDLEEALGCDAGDLERLHGEAVPKGLSPGEARRILEKSGHRFPDRAKVVAFMMCKGGVGKTTSAFFLAKRLAAYGARVLAIDADPQGNLTSAMEPESFGTAVDEETPILVDVVERTVEIGQAIAALTPELHLLPSTPMNATLEGKIRDLHKNPSLPIRRLLEPIRANYDWIVVDCAPALNLTNTAVVGAADQVILPVSPDKFSLIGLELTFKELAQIEEDFSLQVAKKIVFTRFDARESTSNRYLEQLTKAHAERMFRTTIRTSSDVKNAISQRFDLFALGRSKAREDYDALTRELLELPMMGRTKDEAVAAGSRRSS